MGFEAANYKYIPGSGTSARAREMLKRLGAEAEALGGDGDSTYVLRGPDHWIDVQFSIPEPAISFRLALCNPDDVLQELNKVLSELIAIDDGQVVDLQTGERYVHLDQATWQEIIRGFKQKQAQFQKYFGTFTAAISAEQVFDYIARRHDVGE